MDPSHARRSPFAGFLLRGVLAVLGGWLLVQAALPGLADEWEDRRARGVCLCRDGQGTWTYLRAPMPGPEDPPHCGLKLAGGDCARTPRPEGVPGGCWNDGRVECFWKRHAHSWSIRCSACWADEECTDCNGLIGGPDPAAAAVLAERLAAERALFGDEDLVIAVSPHFYVVTNLHKKLKVVTERNTRRYMTAHEVAHLYAERCERAYADFVHWFGKPVLLQKPMAVYVVDTDQAARDVGEKYFGRAGIHMNYAFAYNDRIADGFCGNGFVVAARNEGADQNVHGFCRHQIGHILFSCWQVQSGFEDKCPRWAWVGAAHFLEKMIPELHEGYATYCYGETDGGTGPRDKWAHRIKMMSRKDRWSPIETFFGINSLSDVKYEDHLRAWSFMDLMLREDRERWLALLTRLRHGEDEGTAFRESLGITPEQFHQRWLERVREKREAMGERPREGSPESEALERLEKLRSDSDPEVLAGRIRGLERIADTDTLDVVLPHLASESQLVRETAHHLLLRTQDPAILERLRTQGLRQGNAKIRFGVARALGGLKDEEARFALEQALGDRHWRVRANAAFALQQIGAFVSRRYVEAALATERDDRAWISMVDAFASWPGRSAEVTVQVVPGLAHAEWQVRLTAARALARIGTEEAMDALVKRFGEESGRLQWELYRALVGVSGQKIDPDPLLWEAWWEARKAAGEGLPEAPEPAGPPAAGDARYAPPEPPPVPDEPRHYGKRFYSRSVCFVLDTSASTELNMKIPAEAAARLGDLPLEGTRAEIGRAALIDTLEGLDPRVKFRLVFFGSKVELWKKDLVSASRSAVSQATRKILRRKPAGETNFHGALQAALGLHERDVLEPRLGDMPDTVFFITDGRPTRGEIQAMPELTTWLINLNRWAKVRLHVIALGELNVDLPSLRLLAKAGDGDLIHVPER